MHYPVMLSEALEYLAIKPDGRYLDATTGLGGHTGAIARQLTTGQAIAADRDPESLERARQNTLDAADRIHFVHARFSQLADVVDAPVDGIIADLGVSRYQLTTPERGFSFMAEGPVDMRMDRSAGRSAGDIVNYASEQELADLLFYLGEERRSRKISRAIVRARPIRDTLHLASVIERAVPRTGAIHPATKTFMALRLDVNEEQQELDAFLETAPRLVTAGGRIVVITFMSLEDRKVKQAFQSLARAGRVTILNKHVITPSEEEIRNNPPSRSAKLRAVAVR